MLRLAANLAATTACSCLFARISICWRFPLTPEYIYVRNRFRETSKAIQQIQLASKEQSIYVERGIADPHLPISGSVAKIKKQAFLTSLNRGFPPFFEATFRQKPIFATEPLFVLPLSA